MSLYVFQLTYIFFLSVFFLSVCRLVYIIEGFFIKIFFSMYCILGEAIGPFF